MASGAIVSTNHKRSRVSAGRVRTGCVTCKIRHVKCDEKKPSCLRCVSSGRICNGYPPPVHEGTWWTTVASTPAGSINTFSVTPSVVPGSNPKERRFFHYFKERTVDNLAGYFDSPFWSECVLQIGQSEPAVHHALVALGAIHEGFDANDEYSLAGIDKDEVASIRQFSLQQYNKAIRLLSQHLQAKGNRVSHKVTLICCILFICLESLQGNHQAALSHLESGLDILKDWNDRRRKGNIPLLSRDPHVNEPPNRSNTRCPLGESEDVIDVTLLQLFSRLDLQATTFLDTRPPQLAEALPMIIEPPTTAPRPFIALTCARSSLEEMNSRLFHFLKATDNYNAQQTPPPAHILAEQAAMTRRYAAWSRAFEGFIKKHGATMSIKELRGAVTLKLHRAVAGVMLPNAFSGGVAMEGYTEACRHIVSLAGTLLIRSLPSPPASAGWTPSLEKGTTPAGGARGTPPVEGGGSSSSPSWLSAPAGSTSSRRLTPQPPEPVPTFTFDMGIIAPLYFVAIQCRDRPTQRKAIQLLYTSGRQEGMWDARRVAQNAERIIGAKDAAEEMAFVGEVEVEGGVPELARLHAVLGVGEEECPFSMGGPAQAPALGIWNETVGRESHPWRGYVDLMDGLTDGTDLGGVRAFRAVDPGARPEGLDAIHEMPENWVGLGWPRTEQEAATWSLS